MKNSPLEQSMLPALLRQLTEKEVARISNVKRADGYGGRRRSLIGGEPESGNDGARNYSERSGKRCQEETDVC